MRFHNVTVYYFSRRQGFTSVPSQGGSTLGMASRHSWVRQYSLGEFALEQERVHRDMLREHLKEEKLTSIRLKVGPGSAASQSHRALVGKENHEMIFNRLYCVTICARDTLRDARHYIAIHPDETLLTDFMLGGFPSSLYGCAAVCRPGLNPTPSPFQLTKNDTMESEEASALTVDDISDDDIDVDNTEVDEYFFLQPLTTKKRRSLLRSSGVKKLDVEEKHELRAIRVSREDCGCDCRVFCDPETCACSMAGIKCQVPTSSSLFLLIFFCLIFFFFLIFFFIRHACLLITLIFLSSSWESATDRLSSTF